MQKMRCTFLPRECSGQAGEPIVTAVSLPGPGEVTEANWLASVLAKRTTAHPPLRGTQWELSAEDLGQRWAGAGWNLSLLGEVSMWSAVPQGSRQGPSSTSLPELPLGAEPAKPAMCCWDLLWSALSTAPTLTLCSSSLPDPSGARAVSMPAQSRGTQAWRRWLTAVRVCLGRST